MTTPAAARSMFIFLPQAMRVIRVRETKAISLTTYAIAVANIVNGGFGLAIPAMKARAMAGEAGALTRQRRRPSGGRS